MTAKKVETYQFGDVLDAFISQAQTAENPQTVPLEKIFLSENQPRKYFDPVKQEQLRISIQKHGILQPLIVRLIDNHYELVAGERRYRAAQELKLDTVPIFVIDLDDDQIRQVRLVENLQRENLNPVEETEAILELLTLQLKIAADEVPSLLYRLQKQVKGKLAHNVVGDAEIQIIKNIFKSLGTISWESFVNHRLLLLKLPEEILEALRQGKIEYTKAQAIARVKDDEQRVLILAEAIAQKSSLSDIKQKIAELDVTDGNDNSNIHNYSSRIKAISTKVKTSKILDQPRKKQKLDKLLAEIDKLLQD